MNVRDYLVGKSVTLQSPFAPDEIKRRIKERTRAPWWMKPFQTGPAGGIRFGRVRLRYQSSLFEYNAKPILTGPIEELSTGSLLCLTYRGRTWFRLFFIVWYLFLAAFAATLLTVGTDPPLQGTDRLIPVAILVGLMIFPVVLHLVGTRRSDEELQELVDFLVSVVDAHPQTDNLQGGQVLRG